MKLSANKLDGWTGGRQFPLHLSFDSRFPPLLTPDSFPVPATLTPSSRHSLPDSRPRPPSQFNTDLFYYPLEKLETNSHNHILQSLTMDTFLDIHKLTVPYSETDTVNSKLPAVT